MAKKQTISKSGTIITELFESKVLRDNPLDSVTAYDTIDIVILGGAVIERSSLSARADSN